MLTTYEGITSDLNHPANVTYRATIRHRTIQDVDRAVCPWSFYRRWQRALDRVLSVLDQWAERIAQVLNFSLGELHV